MRLSIVVFVTCSIAPLIGIGQTLVKDFWGVTGTVYSVLESEQHNAVFVGGDFQRVGPMFSYGVPLDASTAQPDPAWTRPEGFVYAVIPDGVGGCYVGGSFAAVGGVPRTNLVRFNADGSLHPWAPNINGDVHSLYLKNDTLFLGGYFSTVNGLTRRCLASFNVLVGTLTSFAPMMEGGVNALAASGDTLYVGGIFNGTINTGAVERKKLCAFRISTGAMLPFNPGVTGPGATVRSLAYKDGLYVAGTFSAIGGEPRINLAVVHPLDSVLPWNPSPNGHLSTVVATDAGIYVGGTFSSIGGAVRRNVALLGLDGMALPWNAQSTNGAISTVLPVGDVVYLGGGFTELDGEVRNHAAAVDAATGSLLPWDPNADDHVHVLQDISPTGDGSLLYAGGSFHSIGGLLRHHLAAFDMTTGAALPWAPATDDPVLTMVDSGDTLYIGGQLNNVNGVARSKAAAVSLSTGELLGWDPGASVIVRTLVKDRNVMYIGGDFVTMGGEARLRIAAVDAQNAALLPFDPEAGSPVHCVLPHQGTVYIGGAFEMMGGQQRAHFAAVDSATATLLPWNPGGSSTVRSMLMHDSVLFACGDFNGPVGGQVRSKLAAIDPISGLVTPWVANANDAVRSMSLANGGLTVGGDFTTLAGSDRYRVATIGTESAGLLPFTPLVQGDVYAVHSKTHLLYVGGDFELVENKPRQGLVVYLLNSLTSALAPLEMCSGGTVDIPFNAVGYFAPDNVFTAELSDATGGLSSPDELGTLMSNIGGVIQGVVPGSIPPGSQYRIRIRSSAPLVFSDLGPAHTVEEPVLWYTDADQDGHGDPTSFTSACIQPPGYVANVEDCDDTDDTIYVGAPCDDGLVATINDAWQQDCTCSGELTTGLEALQLDTPFQLGPNPVADELRFDRPLSATINDVLGRHIAEITNTDRMDTSMFPAGQYAIRTSSGEVRWFIKE